MFGLTVRQCNWAGFFTCVGLMGYALYSQYVDGLQPCPLCVFQRIAVIGLGIAFFIGAVVNSSGLRRWLVVRENLRRYVNGDKLLNVVNKELGY